MCVGVSGSAVRCPGVIVSIWVSNTSLLFVYVFGIDHMGAPTYSYTATDTVPPRVRAYGRVKSDLPFVTDAGTRAAAAPRPGLPTVRYRTPYAYPDV
jgi:hypothetical protein